MNREAQFDYIMQKLTRLTTEIELRGSLNLLDLNVHAETFYGQFINLLFGWKLVNVNTVQPNAPGIDLVDATNRIVAQVSSTATKNKVESALSKCSGYEGHSFKFISISRNASHLRRHTFANPHGLEFDPASDIYCVTSLLAHIKDMDVEKLTKVAVFLREELKGEPDLHRVDSNLAVIIRILAVQDWGEAASEFAAKPFDIEAKVHYNQLGECRHLVDDHKVSHHRLTRIYAEFDAQGVNKSLSILNGIRTEYLSTPATASPDERFFTVVSQVVERIRSSANYVSMPEEELELYAQILVVDAFIQCKIFKRPPGDDHARS